MDILAARKKAAERAKAGKQPSAAEPLPAEGQAQEPAPAFPPLPETGFAPEEAISPAKEPEVRPDELPPVCQEPEELPAATAEEANIPLGPAGGAGDVQERDEDSAAGGESGEEREEAQEQDREMLAFLLGSEEYVVPVDEVQEVLTPREITPVPHSKDFMLGVCSLRGTVLPIIDLHRRLGLPEAAWDERSRILVMNLGTDDRLGLFVDRVRGVVRFPPSAVRPVPETIEQGVEFLQGIARTGDRLFILLDVKKTTEI